MCELDDDADDCACLHGEEKRTRAREQENKRAREQENKRTREQENKRTREQERQMGNVRQSKRQPLSVDRLLLDYRSQVRFSPQPSLFFF